MPERITLAIDGGIASAVALEWALARASTTAVDVRLTTIDESGVSVMDSLKQLQAAQALGRAAARFAAVAPLAQVEMVMLRGDAVDRLARESMSADLIVIGSHPVGMLAGLFSATLPLAIAARSACPVVVVPVGWRSSTGPVVVGVDEPTSERAQEFAATEAERLGRELVMVRAWELPPAVTPHLLGVGTVDEAIHDANAELLSSAASSVASRHGALPLREKLSYATPSIALAGGAQKMELVVVGTHHRRGLAEWVHGSVGHELVMHLPCPIAIVPPASLPAVA
ncbi:universal stress protein [Glaciihabitans sp. INWT7]|uniref:universal stress protein n=1 Tax=Glaciihabitans sp. INWT7 TaxID=2596912 RepID=UPI00162894D3|nr:universal stress protein [Glaciihabitans sp. INWT7]QNE46733.1 universal stress protein [Glaciihabitans sp. INWT7]